MAAKWELFEPGPAKREQMHATLNRKSVFLVNGVILDRLGNPDAVQLLFDRDNQTIGMSRAPASLPSSFRLKPHHTGRHRILNATPFCRHFNIKVGATIAFVAPEIDENGILRLDLRNTRLISRRLPGRDRGHW